MCLIAGDINLDYVLKVVSTRFLHSKVTIFSFSVVCFLEANYYFLNSDVN